MLCRTGDWLTLCESRCVNAMRNAIRDRESFWCGGDRTLVAYVQNGRSVTFAEVTTEDLRVDTCRASRDPERARLAAAELAMRGVS